MSSSGGRHQRLPQNDPDNGPPRQNRFHTIHDSAPSSSSSNSNGSAGAGGYYQGGGSPSCANCCTNCCNYLPLLCKILIFVFLGGLIATFFPAVYWNVVLYAQAVTGNPLNVYRIFVCTYFGQIVGALFAILHIFQDSAMLEHRKGTVWFLHLWFMVAIVVNSVFFLAMLVVSTFSDLFFVSHGPWPVLICMLPLSAKINSRDEYRVCFCNIPAKYYPWLVLVMLSLFSFSYSGIPALLIGLLLGYALVHFEDQVTLSMATLRRLESGALSCLTEQSGFVSTEAGASGNVPEPFSLQRMIMGGTAQAPPQAQAGGSSSGGRIYGSGVVGGGGSSSSSSSSSGGRAGGYYGMPPDEIEPDTMMEEKENAAQTQSVFAAGGGHRLGGGTSTSSSSSAASRLTSLFGRSQAAPPPYAAATESAGSRAARIPTKGLNRLVENAYKQKGAPGGPAADVELDEVNGDSSSSLASTSVVSVSASRVPAVDSSPLLAGQITSDSDEVAIAVGPADGGREGNSDARERNVSRLAALGYSREDARNALVIADDDFEAARQFLSTPLTSSIATS